MAFITDYELLNNAATSGNWTASGFDTPTLNDSSATTPIYLEGSACMWWPLKKGTTNGHVYTSTITGTPSFANRIVVGLLNYPFADIDLIPITLIRMRVASNTGFTTYYEWDAIAQLLAPYNTPISGHTPIIVYPTNPDGSSGTFSANIESVGFVATTGNSADGKQGGFDFFFVIGWIGGHSATYTNTFLNTLAAECYDSDGGGLPGTNGRPLPIFSRSGNNFQSNVSIQYGDGTADTANTVVSETGKVIFWNNVQPEQELGHVFVDPASTHVNRVTYVGGSESWNSQLSTHHIFTDPENAEYFQFTGRSFSNGGAIDTPTDSANRWVRSCNFTDCQGGSHSNGEFTSNVLTGCLAQVISADADWQGTKCNAPAVAVDGTAIEWNGNYDPNGNLDDMYFSKGANAHHAIEFGTASPLTMTLTNVDFSGFNATNAQNDSALHIKRTSGTVTINLSGCTGDISYKSAGATVVLASSVPISIYIQDVARLPIQNVQTSVYLLASPYTEIMNEDTLATGYADDSYSGSTPVDVVVKARKSEDTDDPRYKAYSSVQSIGTSGLSLTITLEEQPLPI